METPIIVCVHGAGVVGLETALYADKSGFKTYSLDIDSDVIESLQNKSLPAHINDERLAELLKDSDVSFTLDVNETLDATVRLICVPTHINDRTERFDLEKNIFSALEDIADVLKDGDIVVIESTVDGHAYERIHQKMRSLTTKNVSMAVVPEFVNPNSQWSVSRIPRSVGVFDETIIPTLRKLYDSITEEADGKTEFYHMPTEVANGKVITNAHRSLNIAHVNELALLSEKTEGDVWISLQVANRKPFGILPTVPGPGVGGHCVGVDEKSLKTEAQSSGFPLTLLERAIRINEYMPHHAACTIRNMLDQKLRNLSNGSPLRVLMLGIAYKPETSDWRETPTFKVGEDKVFDDDRIVIEYFDPHIPSKSTVSSLEEGLENADLVVLMTAHSAFNKVTPQLLRQYDVQQVYDTRNFFRDVDPNALEEFNREQIECIVLGKGGHPYAPTQSALQNLRWSMSAITL